MLKFIYGVMGSSKTAQALMTKFNYEQSGYNVLLLKPAIDTRSASVKSRIGLKAKCISFKRDENLLEIPFPIEESELSKTIMIVDEVQFCTKEQIEQLHKISRLIDVFCYGLKTNFKTELFEGSKRLLEIADEIKEISHICKCGKQANINALYKDGKLVTDGEEIQIGDTEYKAVCYSCWEDERTL